MRNKNSLFIAITACVIVFIFIANKEDRFAICCDWSGGSYDGEDNCYHTSMYGYNNLNVCLENKDLALEPLE